MLQIAGIEISVPLRCRFELKEQHGMFSISAQGKCDGIQKAQLKISGRIGEDGTITRPTAKLMLIFRASDLLNQPDETEDLEIAGEKSGTEVDDDSDDDSNANSNKDKGKNPNAQNDDDPDEADDDSDDDSDEDKEKGNSGKNSDKGNNPNAGKKKTLLLQNFPNPFNPETWMPYQLSEPCEVTVRIHDAAGRMVRTLDLGYRSAGVYASTSNAAYWDGRNNVGEEVASGLYFYTIKAGDYTATKRMLILK